MRRTERGWVTLWVLGLCVAVLFLGGLSVDLWRVLAVRRDLAAMADAAADAGANGLDVAALRRGEIVLDPALARERARANLAAQPDLDLVEVAAVDAGTGRVDVTLSAEVPFTLLGLFLAGEPFTVEVHAAAEPRRVP